MHRYLISHLRWNSGQEETGLVTYLCAERTDTKKKYEEMTLRRDQRIEWWGKSTINLSNAGSHQAGLVEEQLLLKGQRIPIIKFPTPLG